MSGMLASVNSLQEALFVQSLAVDVIDLKQPAEGALGALEVNVVRDIVANLDADTVVSATIGDLPMQPGQVFTAAKAMAATGVDYVKIGFFPGGDWLGCIAMLAELAKDQALIAVLFADTRPDFTVIDELQIAGFSGVMLDTMDKSLGSLTQIMAQSELKVFVDKAKAGGFLTGLAGSLKASDIEKLLPLGADYLGFRGALCRGHCRTVELDEGRVLEIRQRLSGVLA
ncbi:MAG: (5-formylfuran-3-yl)methyl phosphate synthase [Gammaproteobacteria bacterium]